MFPFSRKLMITIALLVGTTLVGVIGYMTIEGWNFADSLYMTVITLTTTGYGEIHSLSSHGRIFTMFLLGAGMGVVAYAASSIMTAILSIDFSERRKKKMQKKIDLLEKHAIVCGFGRMGKVICEELNAVGYKFVVIEKAENLIEDLKETDYCWIQGDASNDENLVNAGVERASVVVSMLDNDADGLYLTLVAKQLNPNIFSIVRANEEKAKKRMIMGGADKVILPFVMSGIQVAQAVINPAVETFMDIYGVNADQNERLQLTDLYVTKDSSLVGKNLRNCGIDRGKDGMIVVGLKRTGDEFIFAPDADLVFQEGDCLITLGKKASYEKVVSKFNAAINIHT